MINGRKYQIQGEHQFPHIGNLIKDVLEMRGLTQSEVSRRIGVKPTTFYGYWFQESIQFGILWKIAIAVNYNFFADMVNNLPESVVKSKASMYDNILKQKDAEIEDLKKEVEIYKNLLIRK
jgi:transcriptional regulator with XRE-family HTH domain